TRRGRRLGFVALEQQAAEGDEYLFGEVDQGRGIAAGEKSLEGARKRDFKGGVDGGQGARDPFGRRGPFAPRPKDEVRHDQIQPGPGRDPFSGVAAVAQIPDAVGDEKAELLALVIRQRRRTGAQQLAGALLQTPRLVLSWTDDPALGG